MKIAYLVQQYPPEVGAGPARVVELSEHWRAAGADVTVITAYPSRMVPGQRAGANDPAYRRRLFSRERAPQLDVLRSWCYSSPEGGFARTVANNTSFMATSALHALVRMRRPDVLIASSPPFFPHLSGRFVAAARRVPLVLEVRDLWPDYLAGLGVIRRGTRTARALFALERSLLHSAAAVVVVTETFRQRVIEKGVHPDAVTVVPNGVDLQRYERVEALLPAAAPDAPLTVGYLGNFGRGQDLTVVVRAAERLRGENVRFLLVGDGPDRPRVEAAIRESGVASITVRDSIPKHETLACYHAFDLCLVPLAPVPEFQDTIPSKIFEIMASERPVLASAAGETERLVENAGCGFVVPPGDGDALAAAIRRFRNCTPAERRHFGAQGRAWVAEHYSRDMLARRYYAALQDVVTGSRAASKGGAR